MCHVPDVPDTFQIEKSSGTFEALDMYVKTVTCSIVPHPARVRTDKNKSYVLRAVCK